MPGLTAEPRMRGPAAARGARPRLQFPCAGHTVISTTCAFKQSLKPNDCPIPFSRFFFAPSEFLKCRLLNWLLAHRMKFHLGARARGLLQRGRPPKKRSSQTSADFYFSVETINPESLKAIANFCFDVERRESLQTIADLCFNVQISIRNIYIYIYILCMCMYIYIYIYIYTYVFASSLAFRGPPRSRRPFFKVPSRCSSSFSITCVWTYVLRSTMIRYDML